MLEHKKNFDRWKTFLALKRNDAGQDCGSAWPDACGMSPSVTDDPGQRVLVARHISFVSKWDLPWGKLPVNQPRALLSFETGMKECERGLRPKMPDHLHCTVLKLACSPYRYVLELLVMFWSLELHRHIFITESWDTKRRSTDSSTFWFNVGSRNTHILCKLHDVMSTSPHVHPVLHQVY
jgi:hypothetical protein